MANKKLKLLYLAQYLQDETDERHPRTLQDMIAYLERCGISAERKSLYDDLELLRLYGMDVQSVRGKSYGYFLGDREFQLPELKLLIDVVQASPFLTQGKSMELIAKLEKLTSRPNARQLRRQVYVMDRVRTHNERLYYAVDGLHTATFDALNKYFTICGMPVASSQYWNMVYGNTPEEVRQDKEGMQTMRTLGRNMAFLMKSIQLGKAQFGLPEKEPVTQTNFHH